MKRAQIRGIIKAQKERRQNTNLNTGGQRYDRLQALPSRQIFREAEKPSEKRLTKEKSNGYNILSDNADEFPVRNIHP